jgi:hypothetical protein
MMKKIKVVYPHDVRDVNCAELNFLIQTGRIMAFKRQNRLVVVGLHPTRKTNTNCFLEERRRAA